MIATDPIIAKKHIDISIVVKRVAKNMDYADQVYIATHAMGKMAPTFRDAEQVSGEVFWGVHAWTPPPRKRLKDPDVVIAQGEQVKFLVEVKWGAVQGSTKTDLRLSPEEWGRMAHLLDWCKKARLPDKSAICRARHPLHLQRDYSINDNTRLVLVSDFQLVKELIPANLQKFLGQWKNANVDIQVADINTSIKTGVDEIEIPSFQEVMEAQGRASPNIRSGN